MNCNWHNMHCSYIRLFPTQVTSKNDQAQYWADNSNPYTYISSAQIANAFMNSRFGSEVKSPLSVPCDGKASDPSALAKTKFAVTRKETFKACFAREVLLVKRHRFLYIFRTCQVCNYFRFFRCFKRHCFCH